MVEQNTQPKSSKIYLDFDSVILDSVGIFCYHYSQKHYTCYDPSQVKQWNMSDVIKDITREEVDQFFESSMFWDLAPFFIIEGAKEFIKKNKDKVVVCSIGSCKNQIAKIQLIHDYFGDIDILPVITDMKKHPKSIDKTYVNITERDIFVEDSARNLDESNAGLKILYSHYNTFDAEWAQGSGNYYKTTDWNSISITVNAFLRRMGQYPIDKPL